MKKLEEMKADLLELALPIGMLIVAATADLKILFVNDTFTKILGFDNEEEFLHECNYSAWDFVYSEDIPALKEMARNRKGDFSAHEIAYRAIKKDGSCVWVNQNSRHTLDENGNEVIFAYYTDITTQKQLEEDIMSGAKKYELLINSIPGGVGMYSLDEKITPIFISNRVYELCGMTTEEYNQATRHSTLDVFHPDDRQGLVDAVKKAYNEKNKFDYTHRILQKDGAYRWLRVSGQVMPGHDGNPILYTVFNDVHEQIKAEQALRESEFRYSAAVKASNINICEYVYDTDTMTIFSKTSRINSKDMVIPNYINRILKGENVDGDSEINFLDMIKRLKNGEKEVSGDFWSREEKDMEFRCERIICTNILDESGKPIKAYCIGSDVTKEKEAEKRYRDELSYREAMQKATMVSINVNLTKNTILDFKSKFAEITENMRAVKTVQEYFDSVYSQLTTEEIQKKCKPVFSRDALLRHFANGETTLSMELTRKIEGRIYWTVLTAHMMKKPENNEIVAFLYSNNITNERTMQNIMNAVVKSDYDFLVVIDAVRNSAVRYSEKDFGETYAFESENFEAETQGYIRDYICKEDVDRVVNEITIKNILKELDANGTYSVFYGTPNSEGKIRKKQLRFNYINREAQSILMTRTDITAAVEEQEKKNRELVAAVEMAEQANAAKSEFLSRISHEIRTPMNAIIGLAEIAAQNLKDKEFVRECIEKSQYSSQYLLLLINDILDMSKIESGKILLKKDVIICQRLLDAINNIIGAQASAKGITYEVTEFEGRKDSYFGDSMRLQQILINILSNAVKFTPSGGMIRLDITQENGDDGKAHICFKISDTGVGMSEEFLPKLFEPFAQEHSGNTSGFGGSGLGLAISKNLAQLMGGDIFAESVLGSGTTFRACIPLEILADNMPMENSGGNKKAVYDFSGRRFLLVEDHQLNVLVAKKLLEYKGAAVDVAANGKIGLDMAAAAAAANEAYDIILMDIRMPVMDGLQAASEIRQLEKPWAKTVPIIAMSANAFDDDVEKSKKAGMNAHLGKPIDSEILYRTIGGFLK